MGHARRRHAALSAEVKQGQEALHAVRVALKGLLAALQTGLGELQAPSHAEGGPVCPQG